MDRSKQRSVVHALYLKFEPCTDPSPCIHGCKGIAADHSRRAITTAENRARAQPFAATHRMGRIAAEELPLLVSYDEDAFIARLTSDQIDMPNICEVHQRMKCDPCCISAYYLLRWTVRLSTANTLKCFPSDPLATPFMSGH